MQAVQTSVSYGGVVGETIGDFHHGVNMLFHTDRVANGSDFRDVIDQVDTQFIRYPGGTISEEYFDITDPDRTTATNIIDIMQGSATVRTREVTTFSEYLSFTAEIGATPIICLPTYRFFDVATGQIDPDAEAEIKGFIRDILIDGYAPVDALVVELGNEFYQGRFAWSDAQFAALQAQMAEWIDEEATALGLRDDITILAQAGRSVSENQVLAAEFAGSANTIDGVLTHLYGTHSGGNPLAIGGGINRRLDDINEVWGGVLGSDFDLAVTEWNVGESGEATTLINGLMRTAPLLRMYAEMLEAGVDYANIWSTQTAGPAGLSGREGRGSDLSPTGYFFSMISEATDGLRLVDPGNSYKLLDTTGTHVGYSYSFTDDDRSVTYFASGSGQSINLTASLLPFWNSDAFVYARVLEAAPGTTGQEYNAEATMIHITDIKLAGGNFVFNLAPYEMVELHIVRNGGVEISGTTSEAITDRLFGSQSKDILHGGWGDDEIRGRKGDDDLHGGLGADHIKGGEGNDTLVGGGGDDALYAGQGNDFVRGGDGDDVIRGNRGDDALHGGQGGDHIYGGHDADRLFGNLGRDYLLGEAGDDWLDGGADADSMRGGWGNDTFVFRDADYGYDRIKDFEIGKDQIDLSSFGFSDFSDVQARASDIAWGVRIDFGGGNVLLVEHLTVDQLSASDFIL